MSGNHGCLAGVGLRNWLPTWPYAWLCSSMCLLPVPPTSSPTWVPKNGYCLCSAVDTYSTPFLQRQHHRHQ